MKTVANLKKEMVGNHFTETELENYMNDAGYVPFEAESEYPVFTDGKKLVYIKGERADGEYKVTEITQNNNINNNEGTKVDPFHTYEDLDAVIGYFADRAKWEHWLACRLMVGLGRRCGDTLDLRWCDLYRDKECTKFFEKCMRLKEEKTGKIIAPHITEYVQLAVEEFIEKTGVNPAENYTAKIFGVGTAAVRAAVKKAVAEVGIEYPVSLHSFRKTYGNWTYKIHRNEGVCLEIIRGMFGHTDTATTRLYIDQTNEDARRYSDDLSEYLLKKENGTAVEINNSPNVTIKAESLREILSLVYEAGKDGTDKFDIINAMITRVEREGF